MNAVRLAKVELGERVAVVGAGLIEQLALQLSRIAGARPTLVVDPIAARRELAIRCGATAGVDPSASDATAARQIELITGARDVDVVFEATGSPAAFNPALKLVRFGGKMILLGSTRGLVDQFDPYGDVHLNGVTMIGAHMRTTAPVETPNDRWTQPRNRELGLSLIRDGSLQLEPLISHRVAGDEGPAMFERLASSREEFFGVLLHWHPDA